MNKEFAILSCLIASNLIAQDEPVPKHFVGPKAFYKSHSEKENGKTVYKYDYSGIGISYDYTQMVGFNFRSSFISNISAKEPYSESHFEFSYKGIAPSVPELYPSIELRSNVHRLFIREDGEGFFQRGTISFCLGYEFNAFNDLYADIKAGMIRDVQCSHFVQNGKSFYGMKADTYLGYLAGLNLKYKFSPSAILEIEGDYFQTAKSCYRTITAQLGFIWGF